jgi:type IV pilus assembly protein PilM
MAVKLLELSRQGDRYRVETFAVEPLPPNAVVERRIQEPDGVGEAIRRAVRRAHTKTREAAAAVPVSAAINKVFSVPEAPNEAETQTQIELEIGKHIPFPIEEINYDYKILGPTEDDADRLDVLVVASRNENVDMRAAAIELGGLKPRVIDVEPYALEHACLLLEDQLLDGGHDRTVAIVDVGATTTILNVMRDRETIYTREQPFGGKRLGGLPESYFPEVLEPFTRDMAQQINRAMQMLLSASPYSKVDQIVIAGGCASIPGADRLIEFELGIPTLVANPFIGMSLGPRINAQHLANDAPSMMLACGLALRSFD